jgi:hypothetical protein
MGKLINTYRPELHYMRGPGPKWLEKYGPKAPLQDQPKTADLVRSIAIRLRRLSRCQRPATPPNDA